MAGKRGLIIPFLILFSVLSVSDRVWASDAEEDAKTPSWDYTILPNEEGELVFEQQLCWEGNDLVLRYEVEIREESTDTTVFLESVETPEITLRLGPGIYRYRIIFYNLLDRQEKASEWKPLRIRKAEQPEIYGVEPASLYLEDLVTIIEITGYNLQPEAEVSLKKEGKEVFREKGILDPEGILMTLNLPEEIIDVGEYTVEVFNPGGLSSVIEGAFGVQYRKPVDLFAGLGYSPRILIYDAWYTGTWPKVFHALGFTAQAGLYFLKRRVFYLGAEIVSEFHSQRGGTDVAAIHSLYQSVGLNVIGKYLFNRRFSGILRIGGGVELNHHSFDYEGTQGIEISSADPSLFSGLSLQYLITKYFYVEGGIKWDHIFYAGFNGGHLQPNLVFGYYH